MSEWLKYFLKDVILFFFLIRLTNSQFMHACRTFRIEKYDIRHKEIVIFILHDSCVSSFRYLYFPEPNEI